jgi:glycosyltransferase involved in cell wall biosynthesis
VPAITVLLPVRNALPWLGPSLASLWRQTERDFEVVAIDDGSTDGSGEVLDRAARAEPRLRVVHTGPRGLPAALDTGLGLARGHLIARHDADDLSHRSRFALQRAHLGSHPRTAVVGCRIRLFPRSAVGAGMRRWVNWHNALLTHPDMAREILIDSPLAHGTAMIRASWLERVGGWNERGWPEDLDLWIRMLRAGARFAKRGEHLYGWRQHPGSATHHDPRYAPRRFMELKLDALRRGFLRRATRVTLVGTGRSLERWREALNPRWRTAVIEARRPEAAAAAVLEPPVVLVFVAPPARERWRHHLARLEWNEGRAFIFVA